MFTSIKIGHFIAENSYFLSREFSHRRRLSPAPDLAAPGSIQKEIAPKSSAFAQHTYLCTHGLSCRCFTIPIYYTHFELFGQYTSCIKLNDFSCIHFLLLSSVKIYDFMLRLYNPPHTLYVHIIYALINILK